MVGTMSDTPFVETDVLLSCLEGNQGAARRYLAAMGANERNELWRALVLAASLTEQAGLHEPVARAPLFPRALQDPPAVGSGLRRLGLFGEKR